MLISLSCIQIRDRFEYRFNNRRTYIQGLQALKKKCSGRAVVKTCISTMSKYIFIYWCVGTLMHQNKSRVLLIDRYYFLLRWHLILRKSLILTLPNMFFLIWQNYGKRINSKSRREAYNQDKDILRYGKVPRQEALNRKLNNL